MADDISLEELDFAEDDDDMNDDEFYLEPGDFVELTGGTVISLVAGRPDIAKVLTQSQACGHIHEISDKTISIILGGKRLTLPFDPQYPELTARRLRSCNNPLCESCPGPLPAQPVQQAVAGPQGCQAPTEVAAPADAVPADMPAEEVHRLRLSQWVMTQIMGYKQGVAMHQLMVARQLAMSDQPTAAASQMEAIPGTAFLQATEQELYDTAMCYIGTVINPPKVPKTP